MSVSPARSGRSCRRTASPATAPTPLRARRICTWTRAGARPARTAATPRSRQVTAPTAAWSCASRIPKRRCRRPAIGFRPKRSTSSSAGSTRAQIRHALGLRRTRAAGTARGQKHDLAAQRDRSIRARAPRAGRSRAVARSRSLHVDSPRLVRSDGPAAEPRGGRSVRQRRIARGLREARRQAARFAATTASAGRGSGSISARYADTKGYGRTDRRAPSGRIATG